MGQATEHAMDRTMHEVAVNTPEPASLHEQIAALAYSLWLERGCPEGTPEEDWFKAELEFQATRSS